MNERRDEGWGWEGLREKRGVSAAQIVQRTTIYGSVHKSGPVAETHGPEICASPDMGSRIS